MILEIIKIEPLVYYDDPMKLKEDLFKELDINEEKRKMTNDLISKNIIRRKFSIEKNEYNKFIFCYTTLWRSKEDFDKNRHLLAEMKKSVRKTTWSIADITVVEIPDIDIPTPTKVDDENMEKITNKIRKKSGKWDFKKIEINV